MADKFIYLRRKKSAEERNEKWFYISGPSIQMIPRFSIRVGNS